jgi:hypothetical protein
MFFLSVSYESVAGGKDETVNIRQADVAPLLSVLLGLCIFI